MSLITAILEPDADGTLHLPVPAEWRHQSVRIKAEMELATPADLEETASLKGFGALRGKIWMSPDFDDPLDAFRDYMP